eukprot:CAMPEP_0196663374 /NCGR_PEP_ID=MMETSP1086-20130531/52613_1 /TAXON_ID=77921 /ORGANISM="Cyanoptyche  gloeocystis , Strain SAG4.97" /LENGTH=297 /DNA_ID=CAMNT_0041999159 /DNA_START=174 /DNA_END=1062 /DNA_ORIENTATION=-
MSQGSLGQKRSQSSSRKPSQPRARAPKARALASRNAPSAPKEADTEKKMASRLWEKFLADEEYVGAGAVDLTGDEDTSPKPIKLPDANVRKFLFADVEFVKSAVNAEDYPLIKDSKGRTMPEVAIAGRSNVGKSSMINHLVKRKSLARTSSTPGATRHINFYSSKNELVLVDLPGYGFASVSSAEKESWGEMCERYLASREPLKAMLLLVDVRRDPTPDDMQLRDWAMQVFEKPCVLVLTKCDQVPPSRLQSQTESVLRAYGWEALPFVNYSIKDAAAEGQAQLHNRSDAEPVPVEA